MNKAMSICYAPKGDPQVMFFRDGYLYTLRVYRKPGWPSLECLAYVANKMAQSGDGLLIVSSVGWSFTRKTG